MKTNTSQSNSADLLSLNGQTVLVTGGTGLVGGRLVEKLVLEHKANVRVLVRNFGRASRIARLPVEMYPGEVTDPAAVRKASRGCAVVFHCAYGNSGPPKEQKKTNVQGAETIAEAVLKEKVLRLVHVSTLAVYGSTTEKLLTETTPKRRWGKKGSPYADSKLKAEELLLRSYQRDRLPVVIIQPTIVYGPHSQNWTVGQLELLKRGRVVLIEGGNGVCNLVHVDDLADALLLAATRKDVIGETFLISADAPVSWKEYISRHERMLGIESSTAKPLKELKRRLLLKKFLPDTAHKTIAVIQRDPQMLGRLLSIPGVAPSFHLYGRLLHRQEYRNLSAEGTTSFIPPFLRPEPEVVLWPDQDQIELQTLKTTVSIQKARERLGYTPRYNFEEGMALTEKWARWANLLTSQW